MINLSGDKDRVLREAFRVLKPGGRFAVSDVVVRGEVPPTIRRAWNCGWAASPVRSATTSTSAKLARAGFEHIEIEPTRVYDVDDARTFLAE